MKAYRSVSQTFLLADPFWFLKITTDPHILAQVHIECPDGTYPKVKMYISELILSRFFSYFVGTGCCLIKNSSDHTK